MYKDAEESTRLTHQNALYLFNPLYWCITCSSTSSLFFCLPNQLLNFAAHKCLQEFRTHLSTPWGGGAIQILHVRVCYRDQSSNKSLLILFMFILFGCHFLTCWKRIGRDEKMNEYSMIKHCGTIQVRGKDLQFLSNMLLWHDMTGWYLHSRPRARQGPKG